jgi:hypothetical protein
MSDAGETTGQRQDWPPVELDLEEARLLRTYVDGPRIWDAAPVFEVVLRLEDKGMLAPSSLSGAYALTDAGRRAFADSPPVLRFAATTGTSGGAELLELIRRFMQMRGHHARICAQLADGVYPADEAEKVGELVDESAREIADRVIGWRDREDLR